MDGLPAVVCEVETAKVDTLMRRRPRCLVERCARAYPLIADRDDAL